MGAVLYSNKILLKNIASVNNKVSWNYKVWGIDQTLLIKILQIIFKAGEGWHIPGFLKLVFSRKLVFVFVYVCPLGY